MTQHIRRIGITAAAMIFSAGLLIPPAQASPFPQESQQQQRVWDADDARSFMQAGEFGKAATAWEMVVDRDPSNGEAWHMLGYCVHMDGRIEEALPIHRIASEFEDYRGIALYNVGCANALLGNTDAAFEALFKSRAAGFTVAENAASDSDLASLRDDPRFAGLIGNSPPSRASAGEPAPAQPQQSRQGGSNPLLAQMQMVVEQAQQFLKYQWPSVREQLVVALDEAAVQAQQALQLARHEIENNEKLAMIAQMIQQKMAGGRASAQPQRQEVRVAPPARQAPPPPPVQDAVEAVEVPTLQQAQQFQAAGEWSQAVSAYVAIIKQQPDNVAARFGHAYCLHMSGDYEAAIKAHKKAATYQQTRGIATYNLACAYALTGKTDAAIEALYAAHEAGFQLNGQMQGDSDLDSLRDDPRYKALAREVEGGGARD